MAAEPLKTGTSIPGCLHHSYRISGLPSSLTFLIIQGLFPEAAVMPLVWSFHFIGKGNVTQKSKNGSLFLQTSTQHRDAVAGRGIYPPQVGAGFPGSCLRCP